MKRIIWVFVSAIFFWMPAVICLRFFLPYSGSFLMAVAMVLTGAVTLIGSVLLLSEVSRKNRKFYLAVPFCIDTLVIVAAGAMVFLTGKPFLSDPVSMAETISIVALALLALCSAMWFYSLPEKGTVTRISIALSLLIGVFSVFVIILTLRDFSIRPTIHAMLGLLWLYWLIGMPAIGMCFIASAVLDRDDRSDAR
jgi:hypothetical protein